MEPDYGPDEAMADYAAAKDLGLNPPRDLPATSEGVAQLIDWLNEQGLIGVRHRWLAEHGRVAWCPDWCQRDHGPVQIVDPRKPVGHSYRTHRAGLMDATYWLHDTGDAQASHSVLLRCESGAYGLQGNYWIDLPLAAVPDLIAVLQNLPLPEGITSGGQP